MWPVCCGHVSVSRASAVVSPASTSPTSCTQSWLRAAAAEPPACGRVGGAAHGRRRISTEAFLNDSIRSAQQRAAAPWRPVFNSALLMENFCEATSKMLNSLKALSVPALLPVGRQCKSRRRRNPSEMFPLKLASKKLDEFQNMATKEENILDLEECAALRSHHELTQRVPPRVRRLLIFFLSGFQLPNTHCRLV